MQEHWIADRMSRIQISGIRKIFELGRSLKDPIDLSIGQPHFDVPDPIKAAMHAAVDSRKSGYTVTQGIPPLRDQLREEIKARLPHPDREVLITSGTSGALVVALLATINPGDEVILFDPYFVAYPNMVMIAGGVPVIVDTYPDFAIDLNRLEAAITARTKVILYSSPANPTGAVVPLPVLRELAGIAERRGILLISDEIYRAFTYDEPARSAAEYNPSVLVVDGFGKGYGMTGWRLGYAHGPKRLIDEMAKVQQFTFVCAPSIVQHAALAAERCDLAPVVADYGRKRDRLLAGLSQRFEVVRPGGAFYVFPRTPWGTGTEFAEKAIEQNLLVIPGGAFGKRDTHIRISYAVSDAVLERGLEALNRLAQHP